MTQQSSMFPSCKPGEEIAMLQSMFVRSVIVADKSGSYVLTPLDYISSGTFNILNVTDDSKFNFLVLQGVPIEGHPGYLRFVIAYDDLVPGCCFEKILQRRLSRSEMLQYRRELAESVNTFSDKLTIGWFVADVDGFISREQLDNRYPERLFSRAEIMEKYRLIIVKVPWVLHSCQWSTWGK